MKAHHFVLDARTATQHFPGIGRYVGNLVQELPDLLYPNERLSIICNNKNLETAGSIQQIKATSSPFSLYQQIEIPRLLREIGATVYHSPYYLMPYRSPVPTVVTIYDFIPLLYPETVSARARHLFGVTTRMALNATEHIVTISDATRKDLNQRFPKYKKPISVTPLAPASHFNEAKDETDAKLHEKYDLPASFSLYLGINKPHKNLQRLFEGYRGLPVELRKRIPLVVAGAWDERYAGLKEAGDVHFLGRVPDTDLPALYRACDLFVFPSIYEGFGLPIIEAMACGAPIACSNTSSMPEVVGDAALLFDPHSEQSITDALHRLLTDEAERRLLSQKSIEQALKFSWRETAQKTLNAYRATYQASSSS